MRHCLTLDLKPDPEIISAYEQWHTPGNIKKEITAGIRSVGIKEMEIYRWEHRLFLIVDTEDDFDWDRQMKKLAALPGQKEWELLMDAYQQRLTEGNDKWMKMHSIFKLTNCT